MARPISSTVSVAYKSERASEEAVSDDDFLEEEERAAAEQEAEDEELSHPVDHEEEWGDDIAKLNE